MCCEVGERRVAKGAAGGGKPDLFDLARAAAAHALVDGVVLGVDRQQGYIANAARAAVEEEIAGGDQAFLGGEPDGLAGEDGGVGGLKAGNADDG